MAEWRLEHPGEEVPSDFKSSVSLAIESIDDGSADVFLAFEQHQVYVHYQAEAQDVADAVIVAAYSDAEIPILPALSASEDTEFREAVAQFGETLRPEQSIEFYPGGVGSVPVTITVETRVNAVDRLSRIEDFLVPPDQVPQPTELDKEEQSLVGRITALDAEKKKFTLVLSDGEELHGRYPKHPGLLDDFRKVLNSAAEGPLTRVTGALQMKNGILYRFWETSRVEQVHFDETAWGARLSKMATLMSRWDGAAAAQISSESLEKAQMILRAVDRAEIASPGVFPTEDGGVLIEWADATGVRSIEILEGGNFETFSMKFGEQEGAHSSTHDLSVAIRFVEAEKA
ncbi:hypothetical protein [Salinibacterium sp. SWN167]|uniref:hypothetical protein n=1 Tax=Salinibacterium sp. SWN167 TaxID=2792054 RepID=UPI0018CC9E79|nr:hypothetical protein [Salinibacterium sp. SWN167]MBH0083312.1 hypothetical protein [Salinibacterium sp. SWN167]